MCLSDKDTRPVADEILKKSRWFRDLRSAKKENLEVTILSNVIAHTKLWQLQSAILYQFLTRTRHSHAELRDKALSHYKKWSTGYGNFQKSLCIKALKSLYDGLVAGGHI